MNENVSLLFQVQQFFFFSPVKGEFLSLSLSLFFFFHLKGKLTLCSIQKYQVQFNFKNHLCGTNCVEDEMTARMTKNS